MSFLRGNREYREEQERLKVEKETAKMLVLANTPPQYRQETSQRIYDDKTLDANVPSTAIPDLILMDPQDKYEHASQLLVSREDPIAHFIIDTIAENVFDEGFSFTKKDSDEKHPRDAAFQDELIRMDAKNILTRWYAAVRRHGHAWLDVIPEELADDKRIDEFGMEIQPRIAKIDYYTPLNTEVTNWDTKGRPTDLRIQYTLPNGTNAYEPVSIEDTIFFRNGEYGDRSYRGVSVLAAIWDALTYIRQVLFSMGWYSIKVGIGVFYVKIRGSVTADKKAAAEAMLEGVGSKRGIIYSDMTIDELGFIQADSGSMNFPDYVDTLLAQVAIATGIPKDILLGVAMSTGGSDAAMELRVGVINTIQKRMEYVLRELAMRMGFDFSDADLTWPTRYATSEADESKIYMSNTQADVTALDYMTINEIREKRGLPPIEGGDELMSLKMMDRLEQGGQGQSMDEQEQTRNPGGTQV